MWARLCFQAQRFLISYVQYRKHLHEHRMMILQSPLASSSKLGIEFKKPFSLNSISSRVSFKCCSDKIGNTEESSEGFSVLKSDIRCNNGSTWSTMGLYISSLHVPLSFGGLSIVTQILHQPVLDPQTKVLSVLVLQTLELIGASLILNFFAEPKYNILDFFRSEELSNDRNWLFASFLGLGFLVFLVFFTSIIADQFIGSKDVNDPILKQILSSGSVSVTACTLLYCIIAPLIEETVYRGFFLTSLASTMDWKQAVIISSLVFSAAHLSGENFVQLFVIGSVLGCSYCWTGRLTSSILIHSLYNALTLFSTFAS